MKALVMAVRSMPCVWVGCRIKRVHGKGKGGVSDAAGGRRAL